MAFLQGFLECACEKTGFYREMGKMGRNLLTHRVACIEGLIVSLTECIYLFYAFTAFNPFNKCIVMHFEDAVDPTYSYI